MSKITIFLYKNDIEPQLIRNDVSIAIDTETMGLNVNRDRLCALQFAYNGDSDAHIVHFTDNFDAPNLKKLLSANNSQKIFHFARFDVAVIYRYLGIEINNIFCTKIASKLVRTYTNSHGLKDLCKELAGVNISKQQQSSYWGSAELSSEQKEYAAADVLHLHALRNKLEVMLVRENRIRLAQKCFDFITTRALLDVHGWDSIDIFEH